MCRLPFLVIICLSAGFTFAQSPHGEQLRLDCANCHEPSSWNVIKKDMKFDHNSTRFTLVGQHKLIDCKSCHTSLVFSNAPTDCQSCHIDRHKGMITNDCASCHSPETWVVQNTNLLHQNSRFPLLGVHSQAECSSCHEGYAQSSFEIKGVQCYDCHSDDYLTSDNPNHQLAGFSTNCDECHQVSAPIWSAGNFTHSFFPLQGGHALPSCSSCHTTQGTFTGLSQVCYTCHQTDYNSTANPNHQQANFNTDCKSCHTINGWKPATFDHSITGFSLTGKHLNTACASCHISGYTNTPTDCNSCHNDDYTSTTNPNHVASGFPTACQNCHTTSGWSGATFDHDGPYFPIYSGKHRGTWNNCSNCHTNSANYAEFSCLNCHEHNRSSMDSEHSGVSGYSYTSSACLACHPRGEEAGAFNHSTSGFPLSGAHNVITCENCHTGGFSTPLSTDCKDCHQSDMQSVISPKHTTGNFPTVCSNCHNTTAWLPSSFSHTNTNYPLTGKHLTANCNSCHETQFAGTTQNCFVCHQSSLQTTTNPNHLQGNFPQECNECHTTTAWKPSNFSHNSTQFPLTGAHTTQLCSACHSVSYTNLSTTCNSCHQGDFNGSLNPNHVLAQFSQECTTCHNTSAWQPANYDHGTTGFALTGQHLNTACNICHVTQYANTSSACNDCHNDDLTGVTDPNHIAAGFPLDCSQCHNTNGWSGATFEHDAQYFPIYSGEHQNEWSQCSQCHTNNSNYAIFSCIGCHDHNQPDMDQEHNGVNGYIYESNACFSCHPTGNVANAFNHSNSSFPLTGSHLNVTCSDCHISGYQGTPNTCDGCHHSDYTATQNPSHTQTGISVNCVTCHGTTAWVPSTFAHSNTTYPLTGGHLTASCADCHNGATTGTTTVCNNCHGSDYQNATNPNHVALAISITCETCHSTAVNWQPALFPTHNNYFVFQGAHIAISSDCVTCHNGNYNNTPNTCFGCHQPEYQSSVDPPHVQFNFSQNCTQCHNQNTWGNTTYTHGFYPLGNDHRTRPCSDCHSQSNYQPQCISCHLEDYQDEHGNSNTPLTCWDCHSAINWDNDMPKTNKKRTE